MTHAKTTEKRSKQLIITADDLGLSKHVNDAVIRGHNEGILRFASLMVTGDAAADAVDRVRKQCPKLGFGLHLVLCSGKSALPVNQLSGIVDSAGNFPDDPVVCGMRYFFNRDLYRPLELEIRAQFEKFLSFGLPPGHVDSHVNIHMHPVIFPMLLRLAREYGFKRVRASGGELRASMKYSYRPLRKQLAEGLGFGVLRRYLLRAADCSKLQVHQRVYGLLRSGLMREDYVAACLKTLPAGVTEIYFHPSADPAKIPGEHPLPGHHAFTELQSLISEKIRRSLEHEQIELVEATPAL